MVFTCKRIKDVPYLTQLTNIDSKYIKQLNVIPEIIKLVEQNITKKLLDLDLGNKFLEITPKSQASK